MFFSIHSNELKQVTALVRPLICTKTTLPILGHVLATVTGDKVFFSATDLDQHVRVPVAALNPKPGFATIPFTLLRRVAQEADKDTPVRCDVVDGEVELQWVSKGKPWRESAETLPPTEFPPPPDTTGWEGQWLPKALVDMIGAATAFSSTDEMRYVLNGVYLDSATHHVVATDGRRMVAARSPVALKRSVIVPVKVAQYLEAHLEEGPAWFRVTTEAGDLKKKKDTEPAFIVVSHGMASLPGGVIYIFRCIEGNFPNWRQVVPGPENLTCRARITLTKDEFEDLFRKQMGRGVETVALKLEHGRVSICFRKKDAKDQWQVVGMEDGGGEARSIGLNAHYLLDMLRHVGGTFRYIDEISPAVFEGPDRIGVLMPMRLVDHAPKRKTKAMEKDEPKPAAQSCRIARSKRH